MRPIFRGFCINRFGIGPLHYISSRFDFGFEFAEKFVIKKRRLSDSASRGIGHWMFQRKLPASVSRRVVNSPTRRVGELLSDQYCTIGNKYLRTLCVPVVADIPCRSYTIALKSLFFLSPLVILNYLMLIFSDFAADHGLINYIEINAKCRHLKKLTCKGTLR